MSKLGHNSGPISADRLKSFIERIEKLEEERKAIGGDVRDVYSEAKSWGYDVKTMRKVIQLRGMDAADRAEQESLLDTYMHALGMVDRIDARLAAGESQREVAAAEGVSKSTVQRRGPKAALQNDTSKMDHQETPGLDTPAGGEGTAINEAAPALAAVQSCGGVDGHALGPSSGANRSVGSQGDDPASRHATEASVESGPHDALTQEGDGLDIPPFLRRKQEGGGSAQGASRSPSARPSDA